MHIFSPGDIIDDVTRLVEEDINKRQAFCCNSTGGGVQRLGEKKQMLGRWKEQKTGKVKGIIPHFLGVIYTMEHFSNLERLEENIQDTVKPVCRN